MSRPGIFNAVREVARHTHDPTYSCWEAVLNILHDLKGTRELGSHSAEILPTNFSLLLIPHTPPIMIIDDQLPGTFLMLCGGPIM